MTHTQGRLIAKGDLVCDSSGNGLWDYHEKSQEENEANARRLVACWNACEGIETESLEVVNNKYKQPILDLADGNLLSKQSQDRLRNENAALKEELGLCHGTLESRDRNVSSLMEQNAALKEEAERLKAAIGAGLEERIIAALAAAPTPPATVSSRASNRVIELLDELSHESRADLIDYIRTMPATPPAQSRESLVYDLTAPVPFKTPPAQEDEPICPCPINSKPDNTTMAECILAGECGCTVKGHEYAQMKEQGDEPVYLWREDDSRRWLELDAREASLMQTPVRKLYTRPDNNGLRKTIEEAIEMLEWYHEERIANALLAALDGLK